MTTALVRSLMGEKTQDNLDTHDYLDDWCELDRHNAEFKSVSSATRIVPAGHKFLCNLACYHNNNYVSAHGSGLCTGDAFLAALKQIELTIGTDWRNK